MDLWSTIFGKLELEDIYKIMFAYRIYSEYNLLDISAKYGCIETLEKAYQLGYHSNECVNLAIQNGHKKCFLKCVELLGDKIKP